MSLFLKLLSITRPKTLAAGLVPVWAGCLIVRKFQLHLPELGIQLDWGLALCTLLSCLCLQIASNVFNDALDSLRHADTEQRQGPRRLTASGALRPRTVLALGVCFLGLAALAALPLLAARGWAVIAIGLPCMLCAYAYTGGPYPLSYHGFGELFVLLFFGLVAVMGTVFMQIGWQPGYAEVYAAAFVLGIQCGLLSCVLIEVNNIRDRREDAQTGKRTLAVRLGERRARGLAMAFLVAPYATLKQTAFFLPGFQWNLVWLASIAAGGFLLLKLSKTPADKRMNVLLGLSSLHSLLFLLALSC